MTQETQRPWFEAKREPTACFINSNGKYRSDRALAGTLRFGTVGIGPNGPLMAGRSDMGMDKLSPRRFDVLGSHNERSPAREASKFISKEVRSYREKK